jgi:tellurite resistance protein TerC
VVADTFGLVAVPPWVSLVVTLTLLAAGVAYSLWRTRTDPPAEAIPEPGHPHEARAHRA